MRRAQKLGVFVPTQLSRLIIDSVIKNVAKAGIVLDLGCGSGIGALSLIEAGKAVSPIYVSDVSAAAVEETMDNVRRTGVEVVGATGSLFEPWKEQKFDYVVSSVSAIAESLAEISPWYVGVPCETGEDGTLLTCRTLDEAPAHLYNGGVFFFAVATLSDRAKVLDNAHKRFEEVQLIGDKCWPLPDSMTQDWGLLDDLQQKGFIQLRKKFGMYFWMAEVFAARKVRKNE